MAKRISDEEKIKRDSEKKERIRRKKLEAYTSKYNKFSEYVRKKHEELLMEERKKEKEDFSYG